MTAPAAVNPQDTTGLEAYISVKEAAVFLSIPVNTCYKLCLSRCESACKNDPLRGIIGVQY
jgi:hypothetical protein